MFDGFLINTRKGSVKPNVVDVIFSLDNVVVRLLDAVLTVYGNYCKKKLSTVIKKITLRTITK